MFKRKKEDFYCSRCQTYVKGNGYTDHCPNCLWSKHVDKDPGDRQARCGGLMEPIGLESKSDHYIIHYQCLDCNYHHRVKSSPDDNFEEILKIFSQSPL